jgi:16S rRNA (uracil1498-N3)-methyltransferase
MELIRFYCNPITQPVIELTGQQAHHLAAVRRLKPGDSVELFDGLGTLAVATIKTANHKKSVLQIERLTTTQKLNHPQIIIAASCPKGDRLDWLITECTELGADRITPVLFERTVKQPKNPKIADRWHNIAVAAAKQSRRLFLPKIDLPLNLKQTVKQLKTDYPDAKLLLGSLETNCHSIIQSGILGTDIIAFIGPEGGLTIEEQSFLINEGAKQVRITDTVLRVETAAIAFTSVLTAQRDALK